WQKHLLIGIDALRLKREGIGQRGVRFDTDRLSMGRIKDDAVPVFAAKSEDQFAFLLRIVYVSSALIESIEEAAKNIVELRFPERHPCRQALRCLTVRKPPGGTQSVELPVACDRHLDAALVRAPLCGKG